MQALVTKVKPKVDYNAWAPGISSEIPGALLPAVTLFRPENSNLSYEDAKTDANYCGLKPADMAEPTVARLIVHEVLIRVSADLSVPDGPEYAELGINLRQMTRMICNHVYLTLPDMQAHFEALSEDVQDTLYALLEQDLRSSDKPKVKGGIIRRFFGHKSTDPPADPPEMIALKKWRETSGSALEQACAHALSRVVSGLVRQHGRLMADDTLITRLALRLVMSSYGSEQVGEWIAPLFTAAAQKEGYHFLPTQDAPCILNVKGASASGKSTIRPLQRMLASKLGISWEDFALISPDYWRKFLLDYDSLGNDYKYAAMLTGQELEIVDKKLDAYVARKAASNAIPHMLIDRFRFDSFTADDVEEGKSNLLTRFGDTVYLFFIITPPSETVLRAWKRGITTGRYKAVDDLLYHNIEAYTGIPPLFFRWINSTEKNVHFEFLDNSVPLGERPRTIAFGWNDSMTILDVEKMGDIDRFAKVNLDATTPKDVLFASTGEPFQFLRDCVARVQNVRLAEFKNGLVWAESKDGQWLKSPQKNIPENLRKIIENNIVDGDISAKLDPIDIEQEKQFTLGAWGKVEGS